MGATGLTGQALGQQDATRIRELLLQSVTMGLVIGIGIILARADNGPSHSLHVSK